MDSGDSSVLRAACLSLSLRMHILHACPGIITISACVLRIRDYYFSGELASFPLPRPYIEKKIDKMDKINQLIYNPRERENRDRLFRGRCPRKFFFWKFLLWEDASRSLQTFRRKYSNIYSTPSLYNAVVLQSRCTREPDTFQQKTKTGREKKISKKAFTSRPMNRRNFSSRGFFVFDSAARAIF